MLYNRSKYERKARKLLATGFYVAGYGHFNITVSELSYILYYIDIDNYEAIANLYKDLEKERL